MKKIRYISLLLVFAFAVSSLISCSSMNFDEFEDEEGTGVATTAPAGNVQPDITTQSASQLKPSGEIIDVIDKTFDGFNDLQTKNGNEYEDLECRDIVETLCHEGFIVCDINSDPNMNEEGEFRNRQSILVIEVITMAINAFSKENKIDVYDDNWYGNVKERLKEDGVPTKFLQLIIGDVNKDKTFDDVQDQTEQRKKLFEFLDTDEGNKCLKKVCDFDELALILTFSFDHYSGQKLTAQKNLINLDIADIKGVVGKFGMSSKDLSATNVVPIRESMARYIYKLVDNFSLHDYHGLAIDKEEAVTTEIVSVAETK